MAKIIKNNWPYQPDFYGTDEIAKWYRYHLENSLTLSYKVKHMALTGVAQWIEYQPVNQRVAGPIPSQAHAWVTGQVPRWRQRRGNHTLMFLSLSFSLPSPLSKNK